MSALVDAATGMGKLLPVALPATQHLEVETAMLPRDEFFGRVEQLPPGVPVVANAGSSWSTPRHRAPGELARVACAAVFGVLLVRNPPFAPARLAGVVVAVMGAGLVVRGWRVAVLCEQGEVTVRGLLQTRSIPRTAVIELTGFPALRWRSPRPLPGWTPIVAIMRSPGVLAGIHEHNEQLRRLERWLTRRS